MSLIWFIFFYRRNVAVHVHKFFFWLACTYTALTSVSGASPFCAFYAIHLQQKMLSTTVAAIMSQINFLRLLEKLGTSVRYRSPFRTGCATVSVLFFSDSGRLTDYGQLTLTAGFGVGSLSEGSVVYTPSWMGHMSELLYPPSWLVLLTIRPLLRWLTKGRILNSHFWPFFVFVHWTNTKKGHVARLLIALDSRDIYE